VLADLVGRSVSVARARTVEPGTERAGALADYRAETGAVGVVCIADVRLTNALGAALNMTDAAEVESAVDNQTIDNPTMESFREVVNVITALFNSSATPTVKFRDVQVVPSQLPAETAQLVDTPKARRDFDVTVEDYGTGTLSVLLG
jgi:hypothetical protein